MSVAWPWPLRRINLLFVGDSIWCGYGTGSPAGPRPALISRMCARGYAVQCLGSQIGPSAGQGTGKLRHECYPGHGTPDFIAAPTRITNIGAMGTGSIVIMCLGANEVGGSAAYDNSDAVWASNMATLRDLAENIADHVVILPIYTGSWTAGQITRAAEYAAVAPTLATAKTIVCTTYRTDFVIGTDLIAADVSHLNDWPGSQRAADAVEADMLAAGVIT